MELFETTIRSLRAFVGTLAPQRRFTSVPADSWPRGKRGNIVLKEDTGLELGNPDKESLSCLLWTGDLSQIADGRITLVGPDFPESPGMSLPFGKVILAGVEGFDEDNAYDRHKDLDFLRYDLNLDGVMLRAVSQYMREWCRVSRNALMQGFSAVTLGSALMDLFHGKPYVKSVEVIFFTSYADDVRRLREITSPAERIIVAMNKMAREIDYDCASCDYQDVCDEAEGLKGMRDRLKDRAREAAHA